MKITNIEIKYANLCDDEATVNYECTGDIEGITQEPAGIRSITLTTDEKWAYIKNINTTTLTFNFGELVISHGHDTKGVCYVSGEGLEDPEEFDGDIHKLIREMQIPITSREVVELEFTAVRAQMRTHMKFI